MISVIEQYRIVPKLGDNKKINWVSACEGTFGVNEILNILENSHYLANGYSSNRNVWRSEHLAFYLTHNISTAYRKAKESDHAFTYLDNIPNIAWNFMTMFNPNMWSHTELRVLFHCLFLKIYHINDFKKANLIRLLYIIF